MSTVTELRLYQDVGFTEGCLEVPSVSHASDLPSPYLTFRDLNPSRARMFSEIRVPEDYVTLLSCSYLSMTLDNNNGNDMTFYGWIDSAEMVSDTDGAPMTAIKWHVDLWRTYIASADFGLGTVRRRPNDSGNKPPQDPPYRFRTSGSALKIGDPSHIWWIFVCVSATNGDTTTLEYRAVPVSLSGTLFNSGLKLRNLQGTTTAMPLSKIYSGEFDEIWQLNPENILSVFLSPEPPCAFTGEGTETDPITIAAAAGAWSVVSGTDSSYYIYNSNLFQLPFKPIIRSFGSARMTDDVYWMVIRGLSGETIGTLPWGISVSQCEARVVFSVTGAYCQYRFMPAGNSPGSYDWTASNQMGLVFTVPCWTLDVTANSWSSYVYSGQRQYDMDMRAMQSESNAVSGVLSAGSGAVQGAMAGAMMGSALPVVGTAAGAAVGAVSGALTSLLTAGANYAYETMSLNDRLQDAEDMLHAKQADPLLLPGTGVDCMLNGSKPSMMVTGMDTYSFNQYHRHIGQYGIKVCEAYGNVTTIIESGGPLQIENLFVGGPIPPAAKRYIRERFAQGVILK